MIIMASCSGRVALFQRIGGSIIPDRWLSLTGLVAQLGVEYPIHYRRSGYRQKDIATSESVGD